MAITKRTKRASTKTKTASRESTKSKVEVDSGFRVITGKARSSYMRVLQLEEDDNGNRICSTGVMIPKKDKKTIAKIKATIRAAATKKFGSEVDIFKSKKMRQPLHDGDEMMADPESSMGKEGEGMYILTAKSYKVPGVVNKHNERITDRDELEEICVSGFYFYFSLVFKPYSVETQQGTSKGVRCLLGNLMFIGEGERLDGGKSAEEDFEDFAVDDDDDDDDD